MSELISRKAILKNIEKIRQDALMMDDTRRASIIMNGMNLCEEAVRNQLSVQPERKKGKNISQDGFLCSECKFGDFGGFHGYEPNFCPNCGADMRGDIDG